jgi:hypothetical protein
VVGDLGKAMQVSVSPGEAALREMVTRDESEGHCFRFAASLLHKKKAFAKPNEHALVMRVSRVCK